MAREDAVELAIARPGRVRRALLLAGATGIAFAVAAIAVALDARAPKEVLFVLATFLFACFCGAVRAALLGRVPLRLVLGADRVVVANARPWSGENVRLPRSAIATVEQMPTGIAVRLTDGSVRPVVRDLTFEQVRFVERLLSAEAQRT